MSSFSKEELDRFSSFCGLTKHKKIPSYLMESTLDAIGSMYLKEREDRIKKQNEDKKSKTFFEMMMPTPYEISFNEFLDHIQHFLNNDVEFDKEFEICHDNFRIKICVTLRDIYLYREKIGKISLDIVQIEIAPHMRRLGYGLRIFQFLKQKTSTDFIFVKCINSDELTAFMDKKARILKASPFIDEYSGWIIEK